MKRIIKKIPVQSFEEQTVGVELEGHCVRTHAEHQPKPDVPSLSLTYQNSCAIVEASICPTDLDDRGPLYLHDLLSQAGKDHKPLVIIIAHKDSDPRLQPCDTCVFYLDPTYMGCTGRTDYSLSCGRYRKKGTALSNVVELAKRLYGVRRARLDNNVLPEWKKSSPEMHADWCTVAHEAIDALKGSNQ